MHVQRDVTDEIHGQPIACDQNNFFVFVFIDKKFSWEEHISLVCGKVAKGIGIISKVSKYLDKKTHLYIHTVHTPTRCETFLPIMHECIGKVTKKELSE